MGNECLWASDPLFLNDARELRAGKQRLIDSIEPALELLARQRDESERTTIKGLFAGFMTSAIDDVIDFIKAVDPLVAVAS